MKLTTLLNLVHPAVLDYEEWLKYGMGIKNEGISCDTWDRWSQSDKARYVPGACVKKWKSFKGSANPVGIGTLMRIARDHGISLPEENNNGTLEWDSCIGGKDDYKIIDPDWIDDQCPIDTPADDWDAAEQLTRYIKALFHDEDIVSYVTESNDKGNPANCGRSDRTAVDLVAAVKKHKRDIAYAIGDWNKSNGAWIRFNPVDGKGVTDSNITEFRYALVESDKESIERQRAVYEELELPIAALVHSGNKSLHAIVRIEASGVDEYRKRVEFLYKICKKNGLEIDTQNKNPARLSRMPGVTRGEQKQFIVATNLGRQSWEDWEEWIEAKNDDLPDPECLGDFWDNMPDKSPPLIDNILRQGHKMLLAGSSKAGKSFCLIELCIAIAEGKEWLGRQCSQGRVLYVNLELDRASCLHRFKDVYAALGWAPDNFRNIDIWNLRGKAVPMDRLAPKLIRRAHKKGYIAVIIDPIYKVITGDENAADKMAAFCNQFDKVCNDLNAAVIYCHHHSKGAQGGKRSMDRASGSGVFARDPDALLDLIELNIPNTASKSEKEVEDLNDWTCVPDTKTAWRVEGTMREFAPLRPIDIWFDYPIHTLDETGELAEAKPDEAGQWGQRGGKGKSEKDKWAEKVSNTEKAFKEIVKKTGVKSVSLEDLAKHMKHVEKTVKRYVDRSEKLTFCDTDTVVSDSEKK